MLSVEQSLAVFFGFDSSLMFNSGYDANIGFFGAVPQRGDTIVYDELIHASVRDGVRLSLANGISFKHNNVKDLERKLISAKGTVYVVVESLYSMDGDLAPLKSIALITRQYSAYLIVDEAHACGVYGTNGKGLVAEAGIEKDVFAKLVTFGKAYG
jgi:8-amino-7-oxononanoate synthase